MRKFETLSLIFSLFLILQSITVSADDRIKWAFEFESKAISSPAIWVDGTIYSSSYNEFYALSNDGKLKWKFETEGIKNTSPAIGSDGTIYFGSDNTLYALSNDGKLKWKFETEGNIDSPIAIGSDGTIYFGSYDTLYALFDNGTTKWKHFFSGEDVKTLAIGGDGTIYVNTEYSSTESLSQSSIVSLVFLDPDHALYALHSDGTVKWSIKFKEGVSINPVIGKDGTIYAQGDSLSTLVAIKDNGSSYKIKWSFNSDEYDFLSLSGVIGSDNEIYVACSDRESAVLYAIEDNDDSYSIKWQQNLDSPCLFQTMSADGTLYVSTITYLYAIDSDSEGIADSPWPKFQGDVMNTGAVIGSNEAVAYSSVDNDSYIRIRTDCDKMIDKSKTKLMTKDEAIDNGSISTTNMPNNIDINKVITMSIITKEGTAATITIDNITASSEPVFYKYVKATDSWIDLKNCSDCEFSAYKTGDDMYTISYTVVDGGFMDSDGLVNGVIEDPIVVATEYDTPTTPSSVEESGGCTITPHSNAIDLILILFVGLLLAIRRKLV